MASLLCAFVLIKEVITADNAFHNLEHILLRRVVVNASLSSSPQNLFCFSVQRLRKVCLLYYEFNVVENVTSTFLPLLENKA